MTRIHAFEPKVVVEVRKLKGQRLPQIERKPMGRAHAITRAPAASTTGIAQTAKAS